MKIKCPRCEMKTTNQRWNGMTLVYAKKHQKQPNITYIGNAIKNDSKNLNYICPSCNELVEIEEIKSVNNYE